MAYNNGYPFQQYIPQYPSYQQSNNGIIWVQGEAGAKSYLVAPNSTVQLWDSESQSIYLKSADASGMPSMKVLDYTIRDNPSKITQQDQPYATKEEIERLQTQLRSLKTELDGLIKKGVSADD